MMLHVNIPHDTRDYRGMLHVNNTDNRGHFGMLHTCFTLIGQFKGAILLCAH